MKRSDYPGGGMQRKELHERLGAAYQLASRLLLCPEMDAPDVRDEMAIVLLDFLADPERATTGRLGLAARGFHSTQALDAYLARVADAKGRQR